MKLLIDRLEISVQHLKYLDEIFYANNEEYRRICDILQSGELKDVYIDIARELYAGGKQDHGNLKLHRQMILGDLVEYIFTGRAYYYAANSEIALQNFLKVLLYSVNLLLIQDIITVNPDIRKKYIDKLEEKLDSRILYEKTGDKELARALTESDAVIWTDEWKQYDYFVDSILPKTLGAPKELIVFAELIRLKKGVIVPLLLLQKVFGKLNSIAPPDFLLIKGNKDVFGIEVGYKKELQSREFSLRTSIPTFAVDLENNMHNRCPICGQNILYCDPVIKAYSENTIEDTLRENEGQFLCSTCPSFNDGRCKFSNYHGKVNSISFTGKQLQNEGALHYHAACVRDLTYIYRRRDKKIFENHATEYFAQYPQITGIQNL